MATEPWINYSPGDLSVALPQLQAGDPATAVEAACHAAAGWAATPLEGRIEYLRHAQKGLAEVRERLAHGIALEVGKPITEAVGEVNAVIAKIDLTIEDARVHLAEKTDLGGPHPAVVRRRPRGPAAVIGPFNFPLHLGHGASVAHLLAGNPVIYKPSPFAGNVAAEYGGVMSASLPPGVFQVLQGGGDEGQRLCTDARVRSVCFTGSVPVGRSLAKLLVEDISKDLALELGGSNALIVCPDADLELAANAAAEGACLTAGQRCNSTSRVIVERSVQDRFLELFETALEKYQPGDPLRPETNLGPLINKAAVQRYEDLLERIPGKWLRKGRTVPEVNGKRGHYVLPAAILRKSTEGTYGECFVPIVHVHVADSMHEIIRIHAATPFGLTASIFTRSQAIFEMLGEQLEVGNLYGNLPTTFSPSTLPFGGLRDSGNGRPGGRGFIRFTTDEQAVQWRGW